MNQGKSFLKRFFALVMALALLVSGSNLGAVLQVSAAGSATYVNVGKLVADNYDALTEAEHICIVMLSRESCREAIRATSGTNAVVLVCGDRHTDARAANENTKLSLS